jgi:RNA polymerase sigma factor (sigma-70 family)
MKTINSKRKSKSDGAPEIFVDKKTSEYHGFAGNVMLYDSEIYIDTRTGTGYDEVLKKLRPLVHKLMSKFHFNGNASSDTKHDIIVHILEGIPKYDPRKNTKLSTFIEMRVNRRLINELRDKSRISRNATFLNVGTFHVVCQCGNDFVATISNSEENVATCPECGLSLEKAKKKVSVNTPEVNESMLYIDDELHQTTIQISDHDQIIREADKAVDDDVIFKHDMCKFLETADPRIIKIFELMYFHDYSIKAAAEEVGLSGAGANMKLKNLQDNKIIQELFDRLNT